MNINQNQVEQMKEIERLKKVILNKILTKDAKERLNRIKLVKPELVTQLELYLIQLYRAGQLKETIDDSRLKVILKSLTKKKEFKIRRSK